MFWLRQQLRVHWKRSYTAATSETSQNCVHSLSSFLLFDLTASNSCSLFSLLCAHVFKNMLFLWKQPWIPWTVLWEYFEFEREWNRALRRWAGCREWSVTFFAIASWSSIVDVQDSHQNNTKGRLVVELLQNFRVPKSNSKNRLSGMKSEPRFKSEVPQPNWKGRKVGGIALTVFCVALHFIHSVMSSCPWTEFKCINWKSNMKRTWKMQEKCFTGNYEISKTEIGTQHSGQRTTDSMPQNWR